MRLDQQRLYDIIEAITAVHRYSVQGKETFDQNELIQVWCLRHLEIIGEAAAKLSEETRNQLPNIPWRQLIGMRNILIHGYFDVNWNQVWNVVVHDLKPLQDTIEKFLSEP
jgi:uncharacterized protein with HEPN domain